MNPEIFTPILKEEDKKLFQDADLLKEAINCFIEANYKGMKGFILEYGEENFFSDLRHYFARGHWLRPGNKYEVFSGIVIAFHKIYD